MSMLYERMRCLRSPLPASKCCLSPVLVMAHLQATHAGASLACRLHAMSTACLCEYHVA